MIQYGGNATKKETWNIVVTTDLKGSPSNLLSFKLAVSLGIIFFHNTQNSIRAVSTRYMELQNLQDHAIPNIASIISRYFHVFGGLGKLKADTVILYLHTDAKPIIQPPWHMQVHLQQEFNKLIIPWNEMAS